MRLIDADAYLKKLKADPLYYLVERYGVDVTIEAMPTIEAEPVRYGKWIEMSDADGRYYACSECGEELHREWSFDRKFVICFPKKITIDKTQFCSHCGAKMEGVEG